MAPLCGTPLARFRPRPSWQPIRAHRNQGARASQRRRRIDSRSEPNSGQRRRFPLSAGGRTPLLSGRLEHIAGITEVRVLSVGLQTRYPLEAYSLWFWMMYAALVVRPRAPRPRLPLVVIDGEDASFRDAQDLVAHRFYRTFNRCQPYVARGPEWFVGGSAHQDSALHPFIQMADLVAGAARHAIVGRSPQGDWYSRHLRQVAQGRGRAIEISAHSLQELGALAPADICRSGWRGARLVP